MLIFILVSILSRAKEAVLYCILAIMFNKNKLIIVIIYRVLSDSSLP